MLPICGQLPQPVAVAFAHQRLEVSAPKAGNFWIKFIERCTNTLPDQPNSLILDVMAQVVELNGWRVTGEKIAPQMFSFTSFNISDEENSEADPAHLSINFIMDPPAMELVNCQDDFPFIDNFMTQRFLSSRPTTGIAF